MIGETDVRFRKMKEKRGKGKMKKRLVISSIFLGKNSLCHMN